MIIVFLVVFALILAAGIWWNVVEDWCEVVPAFTVIIGGVGTFISLIVGIVLWVNCSMLTTIDARIDMYQEENTKIEEQISAAVKQYQDYETDIFEDLKPESSITLVSLYPELKSDSLVQKQLEVYLANNEKIKSLKEEKINGRVTKWWGYFGK